MLPLLPIGVWEHTFKKGANCHHRLQEDLKQMTSMYLLTMSYTGKGSGGGCSYHRLHENMCDLAASYTDRSKEDLASVECIRVTNTLPDAVLTCKHKPAAVL